VSMYFLQEYIILEFPYSRKLVVRKVYG